MPITPVAPKTIILQVNSRFEERPIFDQYPAATADILPGHLVELNASNNVAKHGTGGGFASKWVCVEQPYHNPAYVSTASIDTPYGAGEAARHIRAQAGDKLYMWLADEESTTPGSPLTSNGDGTLRVGVPATDTIHAIAEEAVNNVGGSGPVRIKAIIV